MLKKYNKIWNRIKDLFGKEFNSEPVYRNEYIKTKIKSQFTKFQGSEISINAEDSTVFSVILLDSIVCVDKNCYPQILLKNI